MFLGDKYHKELNKHLLKIIDNNNKRPTYNEPTMDNKEFVWTDELVAELLLKCVQFGKEHANDELPAFDNEKIQSRIDELKSKQVENNKDWEIVSFKDTYGTIIQYKGKDEHLGLTYKEWLEGCQKYEYQIFSVKRSDGEVFTVGDKMKMINYVTIDHFGIVGDEMIAFHKSGARLPLGCLQKPIIEQPLFTTEDGKSIYEENENVWIVDGDLSIGEYKARVAKSWYDRYENSHIFSTKEKAEEYILMNKPCLSLNEVRTWLCNKLQDGEVYSQLKPLVQQKLNQP